MTSSANRTTTPNDSAKSAAAIGRKVGIAVILLALLGLLLLLAKIKLV